MTTRPIRTLQDFHDTGRAIRAFCSHYWVCSHEAHLAWIDSPSISAGASIFCDGRTYLAGRLRCSICGWHFPDIALGHAGKPPEFSGTHSAGTVPLTQEELAALERARVVSGIGEMPWVGKRKGGRKFGR